MIPRNSSHSRFSHAISSEQISRIAVAARSNRAQPLRAVLSQRDERSLEHVRARVHQGVSLVVARRKAPIAPARCASNALECFQSGNAQRAPPEKARSTQTQFRRTWPYRLLFRAFHDASLISVVKQ